MADDKPPCLALDLSLARKIEPVSHPTFVGGKAYICPRCKQEFSSPYISVMDTTKCVFDPDTTSR
jgi:hypothetical protein